LIFSTANFLFFFIFVFIVQWFIIPVFVPSALRLKTHHIFLLIVSYYFYMAWEWQFGFLMAFTTVFDYLAGLFMAKADEIYKESKDRRLRNAALLFSVIVNLGILGYYKYSDFFISSFIDLINTMAPEYVGFEQRESLLLHLILPLGISFFTFQSMSYTIDVYRRIIPAEKSLIRFALFVAFFPQLVAGPIVTAKDFLPQLKSHPEFDLNKMREAARWFIMGYFKKTVLADNMAPIVDMIYRNPASYDSVSNWIGSAAFMIQIYGDFSGYSDMAWGSAMFIGYKLPVNFHMPYLSVTVSEFWRRWHISLMIWIRDYMYIPLGGNRVSYMRHKFNIFITMFLAGVWHGANWTYAAWGAAYGLLLAIESAVNEFIKNKKNKSKELSQSQIQSHIQGGTIIKEKIRKDPSPVYLYLLRPALMAIGFIYTVIISLLLIPFFRAPNIQQSFIVIKQMLIPSVNSSAVLPQDMIFYVLFAVLTMAAGHTAGHFLFRKKGLQFSFPLWLEIPAISVIILFISQIAATDVEAFIYFVF
jgi:alginate O-acetyltransferase complex protein AlgI